MTLSLDSQHFWTYEDYQRLPEDGQRYEVIDGVLYVSPSPRSKHQIVSRRLQFFFYQFELEGSGFVFDAPMDLLMPGCTPVQPDLIVLDRNQRRLIQENYIEGIPHLLVEILSSKPSLDRVKKMNAYARCGVPFYLIIDPEDPSFEVYHLDGATYRLEASLAEDDRWEWRGKSLDLAALFAPLPEE
ncbi:Uma2 family endonuclease [bacterium]|nr:Uma2 family endonuclease [bacterium]